MDDALIIRDVYWAIERNENFFSNCFVYRGTQILQVISLDQMN